MRKVILSLVLGAAMVAGCGDENKKNEQQKSYVIDKDQALRVTRLAMRTAALVGRHAAIPNGFAIGSTAAAPACPLSGVTGKIKLTPQCTPDFATAGAVDCEIVESFACPEATGSVTNSVELRADGLNYSLQPVEYQEGNEALGFIRYNGDVAVVTTPDGKTNYKDSLSAVARPQGDPVDTTVNSTSDVTIATSAESVVFNGLSDLVISGTVDGQGKVEFADVDFGDGTCAASPESGEINLALVGIERAVIEFTGCGQATLHHIENGQRVNAETFAADELSYAFAQSITDIANFRAVTANTLPAASTLLDNLFCAPVIPGVVPLLASSVTKPTTTSFAGVANPMLECLAFQSGTPANTFSHMVWEDQTGEGTFADPTKILVHFFRAGVLSLDVGALGGKNVMLYAQHATAVAAGPVPLTSLALDATGQPTAANLSAFCDPAEANPAVATFCWSRIAFNESFDHLGLRFTEPANVGKASAGAGLPEDIGNPFWYVHVLR